MLKKFEVAGFKNFKNKIVLDFSDIRDYQFNTECLNENLLSKLIIYGKNSVGKTNFGLAIFDIVPHLTDRNVTPGLYDYYLNADSNTGYAEFTYIFQFGPNELNYTYRKTEFDKLLYEKLFINNDVLYWYDYTSKESDFSMLRQLTPSLNLEFQDDALSVLRYIINNTILDQAHPLKQLMRFVSNMLWFRSLDENRYIGNKTGSSDYLKFIFEEQHLTSFQNLLKTAGIEEELVVKKNPSGELQLYFKRKKPIPFFKTASNGTKALYTFYYWLHTTELSFLFIDEFDAYFHFELSESIVKLLQERNAFQSILTSHNTSLLSNRIMRPDSYFILTKDKLTSFANATNRELREGHNLEKLFVSGEFDE